MKRLRRALIELWGVMIFAAIIGYLGPFGTWGIGDFLTRTGTWAQMLGGAYLIVRPAMMVWRWVAHSTGLPKNPLIFWGVVVTGFGVAGLWSLVFPRALELVGGYSGMVPFSMLCSLAIMLVTGWAERIDLYLLTTYQDVRGRPQMLYPDSLAPPPEFRPRTRFQARLSKGFQGDVLALESEDHYVRAHGTQGSELILLRLRDAIAEMDGVPGAQTHRSWWVARSAIDSVRSGGRNRQLVLVNGLHVPVARDSVERLQLAGFLPA